MTSGLENKAGSFCSLRGFTFLELMLVLALIATIFVSSAPLVSASLRERRLRADAEKISTMVREQRAKAQSDGRRRVVKIRPSGFFENTDPPKELAGLPQNEIFTLRYPGTKWEKPDDQAWEFSPIGMVTPLSVRLESGSAWIELDFDLLTGRVAEERYAF